ncbi:MAG: phosphoglucosamine mutase [[Eubacterium] sulci]|jgi:phosphoglucosamine mutase|nr:phosphoglucosamine mutase [[Eubacterium] sulci]MBF1162988.1 phosphoglucosamine mutase [[Eubacterium] sulci]MBF1181640.1 phosphoglucosamine mutase [[Eubacterium] sulci]
MGRLFGTDGVRGVANSELTPELAFNLGKAGAAVLSQGNKRPVIVIGKDTRLSGDMLENALAAGILAVGGNVIKVGVIPTPAVAYLTKYYRADAGIVISASHNPFEYNGIKFFNGQGYKLDDSIEEKIEDIIMRGIDANAHVTGDQIGRCLEAEESATELYCNSLLETIDISLEGMKIVLDCANGAAFEIAPKVYRKLGADVTVIGDEPNGININEAIGSTHPEKLQREVISCQADLGLAYDGDADRLIVVDEKGNVIDGDRTICICAKMLKDTGELGVNKVTTTVMSNLGFHKYVKEVIGADVEVTGVGDRYVLESMLKTGSVIGGEQSGHIIFKNYTTTGDGTLSSLQFVKALVASGKKASELSEEIELFPQVLVNARVHNDNKKIFMNDEEVKHKIADVEAKIGEDGRVLIRPSGTEPLVRVMIEGKDTEVINELAEDLASLISRKFH